MNWHKIKSYGRSQGQPRRLLFKEIGFVWMKWSAYWIPEIQFHIGPRIYFGTDLFDHGYGISLRLMRVGFSIAFDGYISNACKYRFHARFYNKSFKLFPS